jgi:transposase
VSTAPGRLRRLSCGGLTVYPGNTGDPTTVADQVKKLKERFDLDHLVLVGDREMITEAQIEKIRDVPGVGWISALRSPAIRDLLKKERIHKLEGTSCNPPVKHKIGP